MSDYVRLIVGGSIIGLLALGMLALPSVLPAQADEEPARTMLSTMDELLPQPIAVGNLVKYDFSIEPGVGADVVSTRTIRKIGFGRTEFVEIVTTPSGVYSTDGLASPNIRYPGIHKQLRRSGEAGLAVWSNGRGWEAFKQVDAGSFVSITPFAGGQVVLSDEGNCVFVENAAYC